MIGDQKQNPASVVALNRISKSPKLRNACVYLLTYESIESNDSQPPTGAWVRGVYDQVLKRNAHKGRTNAAQLLSDLVEIGLLSIVDAEELRQSARLIAKECATEVDPLFEVARRVLALRLAAGVRLP